MCKCLDEKLSNWYNKKIYIDILSYVLKNQGSDKSDNEKSQNSWDVVKKNHLVDALRYSDQDAENAKNRLIGAGYLKLRGNLLFVTDDGKLFFQDHKRFELVGILQKLTIYGQKNLSFIFSAIALIVSLINFFLHF